jgi:YegS/Rv2252/BmrU family lipid kinase
MRILKPSNNPPAAMRILLIANAHARHGREPLDPALAIFAEAGIEVVQDTVPRGREVVKPIRARAGEVDAIVLAGGDGTLHAAAPALLDAGLPFGVLPRGTANDLARAIDLPLELTAAAAAIVAGHTRRIDIGEANGALFFNVAHIGLGAALADGLTARMKRRLGPFAYALAAARSLSSLKPFRAEIRAGDQRVAIRTVDVTVGNGRFFGATGLVAEEAEIDDGLFHVFALTTKNPLRLAAIAARLPSGRQGGSKWVRTLVAPELEVRTVRPMPIRADGKVIGETPAFFCVRPGALEVFAPARRAGRLKKENPPAGAEGYAAS